MSDKINIGFCPMGIMTMRICYSEAAHTIREMGNVLEVAAILASSPGFSLLPRNSLRMTFDPPERKAEGEPGPFSHVIATRIYVR